MNSIKINGEECRQIKGFEYYHISESGRIYRTKALNKKEQALLNEGNLYIIEKKIDYRVRYGKFEPATVSLKCSKKKLYNKRVCNVVAFSFGIIDNMKLEQTHSIGYKDGNIRNLHYTNLFLNTEPIGIFKLTKTDVIDIKKQIKEGIPLRHISYKYGVSEMQINRIKTGENWGNGKRKIKAPVAPFEVKDGKIRKYIAIFERQEVSQQIRKPFYVKRNPENPEDNLIIGILNGYKLTLKHSNITRARINADKLNAYFFKNLVKEEELV